MPRFWHIWSRTECLSRKILSRMTRRSTRRMTGRLPRRKRLRISRNSALTLPRLRSRETGSCHRQGAGDFPHHRDSRQEEKNNPMIIGEPGVGKSAIVEGIALQIAQGKISPALAKKRIISLDIASVVAGTKYRGDFEKRIKSIINAASKNPDIILFIDEFHTIVGAGGGQGSLDAANMLKPALARGEIQCIGATTLDEFTKSWRRTGLWTGVSRKSRWSRLTFRRLWPS